MIPTTGAVTVTSRLPSSTAVASSPIMSQSELVPSSLAIRSRPEDSIPDTPAQHSPAPSQSTPVSSQQRHERYTTHQLQQQRQLEEQTLLLKRDVPPSQHVAISSPRQTPGSTPNPDTPAFRDRVLQQQQTQREESSVPQLSGSMKQTARAQQEQIQMQQLERLKQLASSVLPPADNKAENARMMREKSKYVDRYCHCHF